MDVSEYPVTGNSFYGSSNPNVSYYAFTAVVSDKTLQLEDQDWVTVNYEASAAENIMVIQKAFVRNDNNKNYVYKDDNGIPVSYTHLLHIVETQPFPQIL